MLKIALHVVNAADIKQHEPASPKTTHLSSSWSAGRTSIKRLARQTFQSGPWRRNYQEEWEFWEVHADDEVVLLNKYTSSMFIKVWYCHMPYVMLCGNGSGFWQGRGISTPRVFFFKGSLFNFIYFLCVWSSYILGTTQSSWSHTVSLCLFGWLLASHSALHFQLVLMLMSQKFCSNSSLLSPLIWRCHDVRPSWRRIQRQSPRPSEMRLYMPISSQVSMLSWAVYQYISTRFHLILWIYWCTCWLWNLNL